jgi:outer membrane protein assembly factor BamB
MTPASWILVVSTVVLSSFAGAMEWPQFRGPNSSGIGDGKPPVEFGPNQNVLGKLLWGPGFPRRLL